MGRGTPRVAGWFVYGKSCLPSLPTSWSSRKTSCSVSQCPLCTRKHIHPVPAPLRAPRPSTTPLDSGAGRIVSSSWMILCYSGHRLEIRGVLSMWITALPRKQGTPFAANREGRHKESLCVLMTNNRKENCC